MPPDAKEIAITIGGITIMFLVFVAVLSELFPFISEGPFSQVIDRLTLVYELLPYLLGGTFLVLGYLLYQLNQSGFGR